MPPRKKDTSSYALRLTPDLYEKMANLARQENRSMNAQIVSILESWFDSDALRLRLIELERSNG